MTIMYKFKITYSSGLTAEMVGEKTIEDQCLETFGLPIDQAAEMGCVIELLEAKDITVEDVESPPPEEDAPEEDVVHEEKIEEAKEDGSYYEGPAENLR